MPIQSHGKENFLKSYQDAKEIAADETGLPPETFPEQAPFTFEQVMDESYLPE
ncbi:MAG: DUF29 family protein [Leptospiraceae bacterium]|nr:DUF29 family protein [Leptospiraceae bacterium]MCP5500671.1 DUF29 family protein [Leptospiraceae bacterium]